MELAVRTVVAGEVRQRLQVGELIECHQFQTLIGILRAFEERTQYTAPDAANSIDGEARAQSSSSTVSMMWSAVKPKCFSTAGPGADSPKEVIPTTLPSRPTYLYQPSV
jgi:hypothetical protein